MTVSQQRSRLTSLVDIYCHMSGMEGLMSQQHIDNIVAQQPTDRSGDFVVLHEHVRWCLNDLGLSMIEAIDSMEADKFFGLVSSVVKLFVEAVDGIS